MAEPARLPLTLDSAIAAVVKDLQNVMMLPHGWHSSFSLRLSSDSASVLVSFKPEQIGPTIEGKKRKKKRSPASRERSAARGRAHRDRSKPQPVIPRQQPNLNPLSPPFVPNSASRVVTAGSERSAGRKRPSETVDEPESPSSEPVQVSGPLPPPPPPPPPPGFYLVGGVLKFVGSQNEFAVAQSRLESNGEAVDAAFQVLIERSQVGDQVGAIAAAQALDSLVCAGWAKEMMSQFASHMGRPS